MPREKKVVAQVEEKESLVQFGIRSKPELVRRMRHIAIEKNISLSELVNQALEAAYPDSGAANRRNRYANSGANAPATQ